MGFMQDGNREMISDALSAEPVSEPRLTFRLIVGPRLGAGAKRPGKVDDGASRDR